VKNIPSTVKLIGLHLGVVLLLGSGCGRTRNLPELRSAISTAAIDSSIPWHFGPLGYSTAIVQDRLGLVRLYYHGDSLVREEWESFPSDSPTSVAFYSLASKLAEEYRTSFGFDTNHMMMYPFLFLESEGRTPEAIITVKYEPFRLRLFKELRSAFSR
jgi:hypothetical protein